MSTAWSTPVLCIVCTRASKSTAARSSGVRPSVPVDSPSASNEPTWWWVSMTKKPDRVMRRRTLQLRLAGNPELAGVLADAVEGEHRQEHEGARHQRDERVLLQ